MSAKVSAVVVGCGRMGAGATDSHAAAFAKHPKTVLAGLSDVNADAMRAAGERFAVTTAADAVSLCRDVKPSIVSIAASTATHADIALAILKAAPPKCLFIEKPLARTVREARAVVETAKNAGVSVCVNYSRRFAPAYQALARELQSGALGTPRRVHVTYGKGLGNNGSHAIDLLRMLLGEPRSAAGKVATWAMPGPDDDATYDAELLFDGDVRVAFSSFDENLASVWEVDLFTTTARIRATLGGRTIEHFERRTGAVSAGYAHYVATGRIETDVLASALDEAVGAIATHVQNGAPLPCTGDDGLAALHWVERIKENA